MLSLARWDSYEPLVWLRSNHDRDESASAFRCVGVVVYEPQHS